MKTRFTSLLLVTTALLGRAQPKPAGQPLDILLIGTVHNYGSTSVEQFDYPINKALAFRPDAVFGEDLSADDYDALTDYWNKAALEKRVAYIRSHAYPDPKNSAQFIRQTYALLHEQPTLYQDRMKLVRALYFTHDFGNARYQLYQLDQAKHAFSPADYQAYRAILGEPDSLYRSRSSEYHNIFFPVLTRLQQDRLLPMDNQQYDRQWQAAWDSLSTKLERAVAAEADTNSTNYRVWRSFLTWQAGFQATDKQAQLAGQLTRANNTDLYSARVDSINFGGDLLLQRLTGFPTAEAAQMRHYWQLRNESMCQNLVNRARAVGARRIVVGGGSAHRKTMIDILRTLPNVRVYTLNEYQPDQSFINR